MDNFKGLLGIRKMDRILNAWIREFMNVFSMQENVLVITQWVDHGRDGLTLKKCLRKRGLDVRQARRTMQDGNECQGFVRGNVWDIAWGMNR